MADTYKTFKTLKAAQAYATECGAALTLNHDDITTVWDVPAKVKTASGIIWVVVALNGDGVEWAADWTRFNAKEGLL